MSERPPRARIVRRRVDGVLLLDKPVGWTSNQAVQAVKRAYRAERAGHTGTLDPLATGLLPVCLGEATKFSSGLLDADKEYVADVRFGITTATGDAEGPVLAERPVAVSDAELAAALARFRGEIEQVPPMYSALKRDGRPLYEYARAGEEVERAPRRVSILALELLGRDPVSARLRVACSKGTYIRVLAEDLGRALGCGAHLAGLRRTRVGSLLVTAALQPAALEGIADETLDRLLAPADALVGNLGAVRLASGLEARFTSGQAVPGAPAAPGMVRVYGASGTFLGLGEALPGGSVQPRRVALGAAPENLAKDPD